MVLCANFIYLFIFLSSFFRTVRASPASARFRSHPCVLRPPSLKRIKTVYCGASNRATRTAQMTYISQSLNTQTEKGQENHALFEIKKKNKEEEE